MHRIVRIVLIFQLCPAFPALFCPPAAQAAPGDLKWVVETEEVDASPTIDSQGIVYFGDMNPDTGEGSLYALNGSTGREIWKLSLETGCISSPVMDLEGRIFFSLFNPYMPMYGLLAVNATDGTSLWEYNRAWSLYSSPAMGPNGAVYLSDLTGRLRAVNGTSGIEIWSSPVDLVMVASPAVGPDNVVYLGDVGSVFYAFNGTNGAQLWNCTLGSEGIASTPAVGNDGTVYIGAPDYRLYALNGTTGAVIWTFKAESYVDSAPVLGADGTVYIGSTDSRLYALNGTTGAKIWEYDAGDCVVATPALGKDGVLYVVPDGNNLRAVDAATGREIWTLQLGDDDYAQSSPAIGEDGTIYVGTLDSGFYAVESSSRGLADAPWPRFHLNNRNRGYNFPPEADAGSDHTVNSSARVLLNGLNSEDADGEIVGYQWTQQSGPAVSLDGNDTVQASFTAPTVGAGGATLVFRLTATDNNLATDSDLASIHVNAQDKGPTADAGPDQNVKQGSIVTLDGTNSSDPYALIATYSWNQTSGTTVSLADASAAMTTFTAPSAAASLSFELTVTDTQGLSDSDGVVVNVSDTHSGPSVDLGPDQNATEGSTVFLAANATDPDGAITAYQWTQIAGRTMVLSEDEEANATFVVPCVSGNSSYDYCVPNGSVFEFKATATDSQGLRGEGTIKITALQNDIAAIPDGYMAVRTADGKSALGLNCSQGAALVYLMPVNASSLAPNGSEPGDVPYGLLEFTIKVHGKGESANMTVALEAPASDDARWFKYTNATGWYDYTGNTLFSADRGLITVQLTDGGKGDADSVPDGFIIDPSGLVNATQSANLSSSGCLMNPSAGLGAEWLLPTLIPLLARLRKRFTA